MNWLIDTPTQIVAQNYPIPIYSSAPLPQDPGGNFDPASWQSRLRAADSFPTGTSKASPNLIINEFQAGHYLSGLALTVCWGGMSRTNKYIYRQHPLQDIHDTLDKCAQSISQTSSIQASWTLLTTGLTWTNVIASKTLHFLARAMGWHQDPPVPIDGGVILGFVWPGFRIGIPLSQRSVVGAWDGDSYAAYCRYMTAILTWSQMKQPSWTTTDVEATLYAENS